jgi:hypothetical protein
MIAGIVWFVPLHQEVSGLKLPLSSSTPFSSTPAVAIVLY